MNILIRAKLSWNEAIGTPWLIFDFFSVMDFLAFILSLFVRANSPADLELTLQNKDFRIGFSDRNHCSKCNFWKPPRTHHCRYCQRCSLMYDHHCSWVGNCIGHGNLHFFTQYLIYTSVGAFYSLFLLSENQVLAMSYYTDETSRKARQSLFCFIWLMYTTILFIIAGLVTAFRLSKVCIHFNRGITAYESLLLNSVSQSHLSDENSKARPMRSNVFYQLGTWHNSNISHNKLGNLSNIEEKVNNLQAIIRAEHGTRRSPQLFFGRYWPLTLLLPLPGDSAGGLYDAVTLWEEISSKNSNIHA